MADKPDPLELPHIRYEVADHVATVTLNDPEHLNRITHGPDGLQQQLLRALAAAGEDDEVRCVIVTGEGRAFCSGGNMGTTAIERTTTLDWQEFLEGHIRFYEQVRNSRKPTIGAINGICYGAGFILAMHFDLLVAAETARFSLLETRFGIGGIDIFPYFIGPQWSKFLAITGEILSAEKAKEIGLVIEVESSESFEPRVNDLARRVAAMPAEAVMMNRRVVNQAMTAMGWNANRNNALAVNALNVSNLENVTTQDGRKMMEILREEGFKAFREARDTPFEPPWLRG